MIMDSNNSNWSENSHDRESTMNTLSRTPHGRWNVRKIKETSENNILPRAEGIFALLLFEPLKEALGESYCHLYGAQSYG
ncbi:hypothetical protein TNCV_1149741 [Trichonephila clavipes]|nr:hypothetical protein TNCV_1149741 [Trichonephila clavipes]